MATYNLTGRKAKDASLFTAEELYKLQFKECADVIKRMDMYTKARISAEINKTLEYQYEAVSVYGQPGIPLAEQMSPKTFELFMSKIKHYETILYWLYEIDIMMNESELDDLIKEAEELQAKVSAASTELQIKEVESAKRKVTKKQKDIYKTSSDAMDIMAMAANLTAKYNK